MSTPRETPDYHCPGCGELPSMIIGDSQAICSNDTTCEVIIFNPMIAYTPEDLANADRVKLDLDREPNP